MNAPSNPTSGAHVQPPRTLDQRTADVREVLETDNHLWLATGDALAHLVPVAFAYDGRDLLMTTKADTKSAKNIARHGWARAGLGSTRDVVVVEGSATTFDPSEADETTRAALSTLPLSPERVPNAVCVRLTPHRILAWRAMNEIPGRTVMNQGEWLALGENSR